jgi:hypothetical protein
MNKGQYQPGQSGNPSGRPPKSRALADILDTALSKTIETPDGKVAGKKVVARLVVEAITTGKVTFPGEETSSTIGVKDWMEFVKWTYQYLDPPVQKNELTGADGGPVTLHVIYDEAK